MDIVLNGDTWVFGKILLKFYLTSAEGVGWGSDCGLKARVKLASNANFATEVKPPSERELTPHGARDLSMENGPQNEKKSRSRLADSKNERIGYLRIPNKPLPLVARQVCIALSCIAKRETGLYRVGIERGIETGSWG